MQTPFQTIRRYLPVFKPLSPGDHCVGLVCPLCSGHLTYDGLVHTINRARRSDSRQTLKCTNDECVSNNWMGTDSGHLCVRRMTLCTYGSGAVVEVESPE